MLQMENKQKVREITKRGEKREEMNTKREGINGERERM